MFIVTLLSDLGTQDTNISGSKALLSQRLPRVSIIDITHRITPYNLPEAAYNTLKAYRHFPAGSVHILMTDVFKGDRNRMLLAKVDGHYFITPDNGVLSLTFRKQPDAVWLCREFSDDTTLLMWMDSAVNVIDMLMNGSNPSEHLMPFTITDIPPISVQQPIPGRADCQILHVDRYGNFVLNITKGEFDTMSDKGTFSISLPGEKKIDTLHNHYNEVADGDLLCRFNSLGYMEIAVNHGSAAERFRFDSTPAKNINYKMITINF